MASNPRGVVCEAAGGRNVSVKGAAFMRYIGQGHDLQVGLPENPVAAVRDSDGFIASLSAAFTGEYRAIFGRSLDSHPIEVLTWTLTATITTDGATQRAAFLSPGTTAEPIGHTRLYDTEAGALLEVPVYLRAALPAGFQLSGPAIIAEDETSTVVSSRFEALVDPNGHLILTAKPSHMAAAE